MPRGWAPPPERLRLHIENVPPMAPVYKITPQRYAAAAQRHPDLSATMDTTVAEDPDNFLRAVADAHVLVGWRFPLQELARHARRLKWVHLTGAGIEHVMPLDWLPPGAVLTNNRGVHAQKAEQAAMTAMLMLNERIPELVTDQRAARWVRKYSTAIDGKTVAVIGVGEMGMATVKAARRLGMHVLGVRRGGAPRRGVDEMFTPDRLDEVLPRADFVVVNAPLTPETEGLVGRRALELMKPGAGLVNLGRARVVDYDALAQMLRAGALSGAVLDVFDPEPLPADSPLWSTPNLIITPHVSSDDDARYAPLTIDLVFDNIRRWRAGRAFRNIVDAALQY